MAHALLLSGCNNVSTYRHSQLGYDTPSKYLTVTNTPAKHNLFTTNVVNDAGPDVQAPSIQI